MDQSCWISNKIEHNKVWESYFSIFPWQSLPEGAIGFDLGCGSGRWAALVAPKVGLLHCIDPSDAIEVAKQNLKTHSNCFFHRASVDNIPLPDNSADFGYSLGVLHHIPDTLMGIQYCVNKLKKGAQLLIYLYYAFDNKPGWHKIIWKCSELVRHFVARTPYSLRYGITQVLAGAVYFPLARLALGLDKIGISPEWLPLSAYRTLCFYAMRTDALDRFGTRLEKRFTKEQIFQMLTKAGLQEIHFNKSIPYWCAVGIKK